VTGYLQVTESVTLWQTTGPSTLTGFLTSEQMTGLGLGGGQGGGGLLHSSSLKHLDFESHKVGREGAGGGL
jgi:hypothetical protein